MNGVCFHLEKIGWIGEEGGLKVDGLGGWGLTYERVVKFQRISHDLVHLFEIFIV